MTNTPLSAVQTVFPTAEDAFGSMQDLIREGLEEDTLLQANMDKAVPEIVKQIQAVLPAFEQSVKEGKGKKKSAAKATQKVQLSKADVQALAEEHSKESSIRFQRRDISEVPSDISSFVDNALTNRGSNNSITITLATKWDNSAINKLGRTWQGKYTGSERTIDGRYVRHVIKQHGDPIIEALRGQLYMDADAIKIAISKLRSGEGRVIGGTFSTRNLPTVVTQIPINGYTLYAEEPAVLLNGTELQGRTMYLAPTSTTALTQAATKGTGTIPQRRSGGYIHSINISSRIVNGYLTDKSGDKANLTYLVGKDGKPGTGSMGGVFLLGNDADAIGKYATNGRTTGMANVRVTNPYYVTMGNPVITSTDIEDGTIQDRIAELKAAGYDAIVMDYKQGDNYMVMVFNQGQIESVQQNAQMSRADVDYDNAVKAGDMETAAWMVNQAAKDAGYTTFAYHATDSDFTVFDRSKLGTNTDANASDTLTAATAHIGHWFNSSDVSDQIYANRAVKAALKLHTPLQLNSLQNLVEWIEANVGNVEYDEDLTVDADAARKIGNAAAEELKRQGFDGITIISDEELGGTSYVVLDSNQIKSADPVTYDDAGDVIPLSERFNSEKADIRFSREDVGETQFDEQGYQDLVKRATEAQTAFHNALEEERAFYASDEFKAWEERVRSGEISPEFLAEYAAWEEKSGIREIKARREQYNDEYIRLSKEVAAATAARKTAARAVKKTGTSAADTNRKAAVKEFGYTPYFYDAGYILPNGGMLNFSGDKGKHYGVRGNDHRAIGTIYDDVDGTVAMNRFISEGNIRIMPEAPGLTVFTGIQPTAKQYSVIRDFVREYAGKEYFVVDLSDENGRTVGKLEYTGRLSAERVVGDMKQYYKTGEIRQQSTVSQFFSREDVAEEDLERKLAESEAARGKLEKAIQTAQRQLEFWRNEADQPGKKGIYKANPRDVQRFAKGLLEEYPYTTVKASQITERIQQIATTCR